jgi:hypothetical protein
MKEKTRNIVKNFLVNSDETGKHIVYSHRTGKRYFVEVIGNGRGGDWGSYNPASGNIEHKKGDGKFTGSVKPEESVITEENGFKNIEFVEKGSPYGCIDQMDSKYPTIER